MRLLHTLLGHKIEHLFLVIKSANVFLFQIHNILKIITVYLIDNLQVKDQQQEPEQTLLRLIIICLKVTYVQNWKLKMKAQCIFL